ncbi:MAG: LamG domain-containing protein [Mameliella sp.]|nr:LamG domain-containing protein [Phaeodactylibacter sp.]
MKTLTLSALLLVLCFPQRIVQTSVPSALEEGLVAYYSFNDCDARDESGYNSHGRMFGNMSCWCGIEGSGLLFDGVDDFVEFEGAVNKHFNTSDFTVSFYFKPEQYLIFQQSLLSKREDCEDYNMLDILLDLNAKEVATFVHENPHKFYRDLSPGLDTTHWMHFAITREGTQASTYINGQLIRKAFRCSGVDISNPVPLSFGNSPCVQQGSARRFKGVLDELRVYSRALNPEEIQTLYLLYPAEEAPSDCVT